MVVVRVRDGWPAYGVNVKGRQRIDLQQVRPQLLVQQDVQAEQLEAAVPGRQPRGRLRRQHLLPAAHHRPCHSEQ